MPQFFTIKQIADQLGYCERTVKALIQRGDLKALKPTNSKSYRISEDDFNSFVQNARQRSRK